ncbi:MAG: uroporphyrinogen decarboxylase family protein [Xanthomonadales bacterium]|jgi:uroporphyrinogen decarboxylase|nr:uroporphyrinogen decarboxylase family protein [Xanthomonadales bacterium]
MMTPREAFHAAMNHEQPDRLLLDMGKHIGSLHRRAYAGLKEFLGEPAEGSEARVLDRMAQTVWPDEALLQRLDIDFRWVVPNWVQVTERTDTEGYIDMWGVPYKALDDWDHCVVDGAPMRGAAAGEIDDYPWPDPHDPRQFEGLREQARYFFEETDYVVGADAIKAGMLMNALQLRGYDQFFMDLVLDVPLAEKVMDRIMQCMKDMWTHYMEAVGPYVQLAYVTDDFGTQKSLMLSPRMFRDLIKPRWKEVIDHIKSLGDVKVMFHSDGAILPLLEDFVDMGVDILNPVQTSVEGLQDTSALKEAWGDRLCFHGAIDVQQMLPNASAEELEAEVALRVRDLGRDGGYILAPCHNVGHDIPPGNIVTLFETARRLGSDPGAADRILENSKPYFELHGVKQ